MPLMSLICSDRPNFSPSASPRPMMPARVSDAAGSKPALRPALYSDSVLCANSVVSAGPPMTPSARAGAELMIELVISAVSFCPPSRPCIAAPAVPSAALLPACAMPEMVSEPVRSPTMRMAPSPIWPSCAPPAMAPRLMPPAPSSFRFMACTCIGVAGPMLADVMRSSRAFTARSLMARCCSLAALKPLVSGSVGRSSTLPPLSRFWICSTLAVCSGVRSHGMAVFTCGRVLAGVPRGSAGAASASVSGLGSVSVPRPRSVPVRPAFQFAAATPASSSSVASSGPLMLRIWPSGARTWKTLVRISGSPQTDWSGCRQAWPGLRACRPWPTGCAPRARADTRRGLP